MLGCGARVAFAIRIATALFNCEKQLVTDYYVCHRIIFRDNCEKQPVEDTKLLPIAI